MSARPHVAILGASGDRRKFGNKAVRAYAAAGWDVWPVHPREMAVEGFPAYPTLSALPGPVEAVSVYVPPAIGLRLLPEIAACGPREVWFNPGSADEALRAEATRLQLPAVYGCSILSLGHSPSEFPA